LNKVPNAAMKKFIYLLLFLLQGLSQSLFCQQKELAFSHLNYNAGLSATVANCIYKDSDGYIWVSTFDGLNRFDGTECIVFKTEAGDKNSVKGNVFNNILEDRGYNLWIGSNEGLNFYDRKKNSFRQFFYTSTKSTEKFYSPFYIDADDNIWVQSGKRILLFNSKKEQFTLIHNFEGENNLIVQPLQEGRFKKLNRILIAFRNTSAVYYLNTENKTASLLPLHIEEQNNQLKINAIIKKDSILWLGTAEGLYKFYNKALVSVNLFTQNKPSVIALHIDSQNQLWAGTQKDGLLMISLANENKIMHYASNPLNPYAVSGNHIQYIYTDNNKGLWLSVRGKGVDYVNMEKFRFQHYLSGLEAGKIGTDNFIRSITEVGKNIFWCGTQSSGILVFDQKMQLVKRIFKYIPPTVEYIFKDSKQNVWIATLSGLFKTTSFGGEPEKFNGFDKLPPKSQQFNFLIELNDGRLLVSTEAGLYFIKNVNGQYTVTLAKGIAPSDVYSTTFQSSNNDLYVCKIYKGIGVYTIHGDSLVLKKEFFDVLTAKSFTQTNDSTLWISTTKGLMLFNSKNIAITQNFTTANGLKSQYIYSALPFKNDLWLSTNSGIVKFNTANYSIKNFTISDGLQSNEFNTYSFCKASNSQFIFGGVNGINTLNPAAYGSDFSVSPIALESISINDTIAANLAFTGNVKSITLPFKENTVGFRFAVLDYINPASCSFKYMLQGYDNYWIHSQNKAPIRYANLPPGNYALKAIAVNADGIEGKNVFELKLTIKTPWYRHWLFILFCIAAAISAVWYIIRSYFVRKGKKQKAALEKQMAVEQERTRIATDMHDDFGASLSRIKFLSEKIKFQPQEKELLDNDLSKISNYSDEMAEKMNEIVWALNQKYDSLGDLVAFTRSYAVDYLSAHNIQLHFSGSELADRQIPGEIRRNVFLILKESLHNVVKHAKATTVTITFTVQENLVVTIADNGKGIDIENIRPFANGLENMKKRIASVGGSISIENNKGAVIYLNVPLQHTVT
jgi:signal transduction histidine kinase/ligand-binding sensor domain-containing protein